MATELFHVECCRIRSDPFVERWRARHRAGPEGVDHHDWYVDTAVPWLISLVSLTPQTHYVSALPWAVKAHMLNGFVVILLFPFSRLVHLIMFPFWYLWRPYQLVIRNNPARSTAGVIH